MYDRFWSERGCVRNRLLRHGLDYPPKSKHNFLPYHSDNLVSFRPRCLLILASFLLGTTRVICALSLSFEHGRHAFPHR